MQNCPLWNTVRYSINFVFSGPLTKHHPLWPFPQSQLCCTAIILGLPLSFSTVVTEFTFCNLSLTFHSYPFILLGTSTSSFLRKVIWKADFNIFLKYSYFATHLDAHSLGNKILSWKPELLILKVSFICVWNPMLSLWICDFDFFLCTFFLQSYRIQQSFLLP